jgi:H+/Cl- antiporter ClcA
MPGGWIAISVLAVLLAAALFGTYEGWTSHSGGVAVPEWALTLVGVGLVFGLLVGGGLMALMFYSSRSGYDETITAQESDAGDTSPSQPETQSTNASKKN